MAKYLAAATVLGTPAAAFTPTGNLRAQTSTATRTGSGDVAVDQYVDAPASGVSVQAAMGMLGLGAAGMAVAARASKNQQSRNSRVACRVAGITYPINEKFDPLNLGTTDAKMERYTAVEIKHGRIAMIATMGYIFPEMFRFPGCEKFENGLGAFSSIPVEGWAQMFIFLGAHEVLVKPRQGGMGQYDFGFGTELLQGIKDEELERRQTVERNNGRLAMVAIMGMMVQDGIFGKTPLQELATEGWWGPPVQWLIKDIPACGPDGVYCALPRSTGRVTRGSSTALNAWIVNQEAKVSDAVAQQYKNSKFFLSTDERLPTEYEKSPSVPFLKRPLHLKGWVGDKGFDPFLVSEALPVYFSREAELKHGRVCMLAAIGWIATDLGVRFPGEQFQAVTSTIQAHNAMVDADIMGPFLGALGCLELYSTWLIWQGYQGHVMSSGLQREPGNYYFGMQFMPKDKEAADIMRLKELENGRLAMLGFSGIVTAAVVTGKTFPFL